MAKVIMVQGTMSNVGKSLLVTALCRVFRQDGHRVAPFKSQSLGLNSFVTNDGFEMGRAQAVQAEAAGIRPDIRMNPVILKPIYGQGSQVFLLGKEIGTINKANSNEIKPKLKSAILDSYNSLAKEFDIIVIEGTGGAAELNLAEDNLTNMGMAKMVNAPVILVGDIERGGLFAQLFGTVKILPTDESDLIKGLIVNKFHGDMSLFTSGVNILENICSKPVLGVVPFLKVDIDDEDVLDVNNKHAFNNQHYQKDYDAVIDVAVISVPHISNSTDFSVLSRLGGVDVRIVKEPNKSKKPDIIIIPGTSRPIYDLLYLRENGTEAEIKRLATGGTPIIGIGGGYQILGQQIIDSDCLENGGSVRGMELLPIITELIPNKHISQACPTTLEVGGILGALSNTLLRGSYEIYHGVTTLKNNAKYLLKNPDGSLEGCQLGNVYGTYLHGFFDSEECRSGLLSALSASKKVLSGTNILSNELYREKNYDILAQGIRNALDIRSIYNILESGKIAI